MNGGDVIVIVVGSAGVASEGVEFSGEIRVRAPVLLDGIEDRDSVRRYGDRAAEQCFSC